MGPIEKGIPAPERKPAENYTERIRGLEVADSFLCSDKEYRTLKSIAFRERVVITSKKEGEGFKRVWRLF